MFCSFVSISFESPQLGIHKKLDKTLNYWSRDIHNSEFLDKGLGIVFQTHFVYDFSRKIFLLLNSIKRPNFIVWLPLLFEILANICIAIVCYPGCDAINFEILSFVIIKPFFYMTKKSRQKYKNLDNEKSF